MENQDLEFESDIKSKDAPESVSMQVQMDFFGAANSQPVRHANQVLVQLHDHEMFISFFAVNPPVILGSPQEQLEQLKSIKSLTPECVARLNTSPRILKQMIKVFQIKLDEYEASKGEDDETEDEI